MPKKKTAKKPVEEVGVEVVGKLLDAGPGLEIWRVKLDEIREQDTNARMMPPSMLDRLTTTIKRDKRMESLPLLAFLEGKLEMISGHHRLRAARSAGLPSMLALVDVTGLTRSQVVSKQLAHNAIDGEDDPETLKRLFDQITEVEDMLESYIDPEELDCLIANSGVDISNIEVGFEWSYVTLLFLDKQMKEFEELCERLPDGDDLIGVCDKAIFEEFKATVLELGKVREIRAVGAIVAEMVRICQRWLDENGEADGEEGKKAQTDA